MHFHAPHHLSRPASHAHRPSSPTSPLNLQIPSLHDSTPLDASLRVPDYTTSPSPSPFRRRAAVVSHPYAPLGGNQSDPVVRHLAHTLVDAGWVVATFNFRGAGRSKGSTSWTGKSEVQDYAAVLGWVSEFVGALPEPPQLAEGSSSISSTGGGGDSKKGVRRRGREEVELLLAGYSYGSLVAASCTGAPTEEEEEKEKGRGSAGWHQALEAARRSARGWYNSHGSIGRTSYSGRRSTSARVAVPEQWKAGAAAATATTSPPPPPPLPSATEPKTSSESNKSATPLKATTRYLLISPPLPPISTLLFLGSSLPPLLNPSAAAAASNHVRKDVHIMAVWGDDDVFTGAKKYRKWRERMQAAYGAERWVGVEVRGVGHFWGEEQLRGERGVGERVKGWLEG